MRLSPAAALSALWRYGLPLLLLLFIAYQLLFTWIPLWRNSSAIEGMDVSRITVEDETGGKVLLGQYRGKLLILNFWASWCLPCRVEIPLLAGVYPELKEQGKVLLGINMRENWQVIRAYQAAHEIPYPVLRDNGVLAKALGIAVIPALVIINEQGRVEKITHGFRPWVAWYLKWWL